MVSAMRTLRPPGVEVGPGPATGGGWWQGPGSVRVLQETPTSRVAPSGGSSLAADDAIPHLVASQLAIWVLPPCSSSARVGRNPPAGDPKTPPAGLTTARCHKHVFTTA